MMGGPPTGLSMARQLEPPNLALRVSAAQGVRVRVAHTSEQDPHPHLPTATPRGDCQYACTYTVENQRER